MNYEALETTIEQLTQRGKGILAADESNSTIGKRFETIELENTETNRRDYRLLLATTPKLEDHIHGVILFEETFLQKDDKGRPIPELFMDKGIAAGIKVDKGLITMANTINEKITQGLDGLDERLMHFNKLGASFAKWRNVYSISEYAPSLSAIKAGAENLARYAASCQAAGLVPIVEPEILMDGTHSIDIAAEAAEIILHELFNSLFLHNVSLEHIVLKPSMVTAGRDTHPFSSPEEIAGYTLDVFRNHVPAAIPTINFLSGGQAPTEATTNLNAINDTGAPQPWILSFSYGRALQEDCLKIWQGKAQNMSKAQEALLKRARLNGLASFGEYKSNLE